jgi:LPXTG-motif cell wall-anchored protein
VEGDTVTQPQTQVLGTSTTPSTVFAQQGLAATGIDAGVMALLAVIALLGGAGLILLGRKRV